MTRTDTLGRVLEHLGGIDERLTYNDLCRPVVLTHVPIGEHKRCLWCGSNVRNRPVLSLDPDAEGVYDSIDCLVEDILY